MYIYIYMFDCWCSVSAFTYLYIYIYIPVCVKVRVCMHIHVRIVEHLCVILSKWLQCVAVGVLQGVAVCCRLKDFVVIRSNVLQPLQRVAVCGVLQCEAVWCSVRVAAWRRVLQRGAVWCCVLQYEAVCRNGLQCVAVRCSTWQCVAVCYSVLHLYSVLQCVTT